MADPRTCPHGEIPAGVAGCVDCLVEERDHLAADNKRLRELARLAAGDARPLRFEMSSPGDGQIVICVTALDEEHEKFCAHIVGGMLDASFKAARATERKRTRRAVWLLWHDTMGCERSLVGVYATKAAAEAEVERRMLCDCTTEKVKVRRG